MTKSPRQKPLPDMKINITTDEQNVIEVALVFYLKNLVQASEESEDLFEDEDVTLDRITKVRKVRMRFASLQPAEEEN